MIAVLVPVLGRPERALPFLESCREASEVVDEVVFLVSPEDDAERRAAARTGARVEVVPFDLAGGDYARKINYGVTITSSPWVLQAGDDIAFHPGWDRAALEQDHGPHVGVIGTNDLGNPLVRQGAHSTHSLVRRAYIEEHGTVDEPGKMLHEGYWHCWVDNELVDTAKARRAYYAARRSHVEHLHHIWRVKPGSARRKSENDATYERGQLQYAADARLFQQRRVLWRGRA